MFIRTEAMSLVSLSLVYSVLHDYMINRGLGVSHYSSSDALY